MNCIDCWLTLLTGGFTWFIVNLGGWTYTDKALNKAYTSLFTPGKGSRAGVAKVT